jgi:hypothetical protein
MRLINIADYVKENQTLGMTKIEIKCEVEPDTLEMYVNQTKETYVFIDESEADQKIDEVRQSRNFLGVDKKFKAGKVNKNGEEVKPDTYIVTVKLLHN